MANFKTISVDIDTRGIAVLKLDREDKHNAMNALMLKEITEAAAILGDDDNVRAVILSAAGKTFCAGGDLAWMRKQIDKDRAGKMRDARILADMLTMLNNLPKPLIGRVQGNAYGGGIGLMAVCDLVIAKPEAKFGLTETKLGLIPATIGPFVVRRMGEGFARQVFFTSKSFGTDLGLRSGLVSSVSDDLDMAIEAEITAILKTAPGAVARAKKLCQNLGGGVSQNTIDESIEALADCWESDETKIGIAAFFSKETPQWSA